MTTRAVLLPDRSPMSPGYRRSTPRSSSRMGGRLAELLDCSSAPSRKACRVVERDASYALVASRCSRGDLRAMNPLPSPAVEDVAIDRLHPDPANPCRIGDDELEALTRSPPRGLATCRCGWWAWSLNRKPPHSAPTPSPWIRDELE